MENKYFILDKQGIIINLKVIPNSSKNEIAGIFNNSIKVKINTPPDKGRANDKLISFLSEKLDIKKSDIIILKGEKNKEKKLLIKSYDINKIEKNLFI